MIGTLPGDFYDMNDGFPMMTRKSSRRRVFMKLSETEEGIKFWELVRFEFT